MRVGNLTPLGSIKGDTWERIYDYTVVAGTGTVGSSYPTQADANVKATSKTSTSYWPYFATDPSKSLTGANTNNCWMTNSAVTNQRFHIDLGAAKIINKVYYENFHDSGSATVEVGVKAFTLWGSNNAAAFAELTYGTDTNWTQLTTSVSQLDIHVQLDQADPKYFDVTNTTAYRYYAFKFANNWGSGTYIGIRRIELQGPQVTSLTISGLNGDVDEEYILESKVVNGYNGTAGAAVRLNNDTGTNYGYQFLQGVDTTASAARSTGDRAYINSGTALGHIAHSRTSIFAKSGFVRTILNELCSQIVTTTVSLVGIWGMSWNNTADNITSLVIAASQAGGLGVGSSFSLFRKTRRA